MGCIVVKVHIFKSCILDFQEWSASRFAVKKILAGPELYENLSWSQRMAMKRNSPVIMFGSESYFSNSQSVILYIELHCNNCIVHGFSEIGILGVVMQCFCAYMSL